MAVELPQSDLRRSERRWIVKMRKIRRALINALLLDRPANQKPFIAVGVAERNVLGCLEAEVEGRLVDDELPIGTLAHPARGIHGLLLAFTPARMAEMHDGSARIQQILFFEGDEPERR